MNKKYTKFVINHKVEPTIKMENFKLLEAAISISSESGEMLEHFKKHIRDGSALNKEEIGLELGDVLYGITYVAHELGLTLDDIMEMNIKKLKSRVV